MQSVQDILARVTGRLRIMSVSARLFGGSIVIILAMVLLLVWIYAGRTSLVPLGLSASVPAEVRAAAVSHLQLAGVPFEDSGSDLLVPAERRYAILTQLQEGEFVGSEHLDFETLIRDDSPFLSRAQSRTRYQVAKMKVVERMIAGMRDIESASVILDEPPTIGALGGKRVESTASVTVVPREGQLTQRQVDAIARIVAGAHAGLSIGSVQVIDARTSAAMRARTPDEVRVDEHLGLQVETERIVQSKIAEALDYIAGARVMVNVMVDSRRSTEARTSIDEPRIGPLAEQYREVVATDQPFARTPGVRSNIGYDITEFAVRSSTYSERSNAQRTTPRFGGSESHIEDHGGYARRINATVLVPRSHFLLIHRQQVGDPDAEPDDETLQEVVRTESARIEAQVEPLIDTGANPNASHGTVHVSLIPDTRPDVIPAAAVSPMPARGWASSVRDAATIPNIGLAVLAVVSLAMMLMMVRRATSRGDLPSSDELGGAASIAEPNAAVFGAATEATPDLEGREVDAAAVRRREKVQQINELARQAPDEAARLLHRWTRAEA